MAKQNPMRDRIAEQMKAFEEAGGKVTEVETGKSAIDPKAKPDFHRICYATSQANRAEKGYKIGKYHIDKNRAVQQHKEMKK